MSHPAGCPVTSLAIILWQGFWDAHEVLLLDCYIVSFFGEAGGKQAYYRYSIFQPDPGVVEKQASVKVGQLQWKWEGRPELLRWRKFRMSIGLLLALMSMSALVHPSGSFAGDMKDCLRENRLSAFQPTSTKPTGGGQILKEGCPASYGWANPLPYLSGSASTCADAQADQIWCENEVQAQWRSSMAK